MPSLDWSRYRAVSGQADEADASRLCDSRDPVDRAMGEALALDHARFVPEPWAENEPLRREVARWLRSEIKALWRDGPSLVRGVAIDVLLGVIALAALWLLMAYVLPAIPRIAAEAIRTGGMIVAGWM